MQSSLCQVESARGETMIVRMTGGGSSDYLNRLLNQIVRKFLYFEAPDLP